MENVVTVDEAAHYLKVHPKTIQRWCREGRLPSLRIGNRYRLRLGDLERINPSQLDHRADAVAPVAESMKPAVTPGSVGLRAGLPGRARILAVANQKGGVGKTTTAQALGAALADRGDRVLLVDLDPQASLTASLGFQPAELPETIYSVMGAYLNSDESVDPSRAIIAIDQYLALLPSNINLSAAEVTLPNQVRREYVLSEILAPIRGSFNWILIDCPPSLSLLTINALTCADACLIPVTPEPLVTVGVGLLFQTIARVRKTKLNPDLEVAGVILTKVDARPSLTRGIIDDLRVTLGERVPILGEVRASIRVQEASATGMPLTRYRAAADSVAVYRQIAEVLYAARRAS
ncbi:MAG TPA: AAA family ATPase [Chloroflexota bacterium]|nr:AAA family ATPase [Chloroflexota bacterium]